IALVYARALSYRGFTPFTYDFSGWGASGGALRHWELPTQKARDMAAAVDFVSSLSFAGPKVGYLAVCASAQYALRAAGGSTRFFGGSCSALLGGAPAIDHGRLSMTDQKSGSRLNPLGLSRRHVRRSVISNSLPSSFRSSSSVTTGTGNSGCSAALNARRNRRLPERECLSSACKNASRWSPRAREYKTRSTS